MAELAIRAHFSFSLTRSNVGGVLASRGVRPKDPTGMKCGFRLRLRRIDPKKTEASAELISPCPYHQHRPFSWRPRSHHSVFPVHQQVRWLWLAARSIFVRLPRSIIFPVSSKLRHAYALPTTCPGTCHTRLASIHESLFVRLRSMVVRTTSNRSLPP